jgi:protein-disulfide isomerase
MKKFALLLSLAFLAGAAMADDTKPAQTAKPAEKAMAAKTHELAAEVVSVDVEKSTITIKGEAGSKTVPVDAKAAAVLKTTKAGEKVTLTCADNAKGEHEKVVAIKPAAPEKK